MKIAILSLLVLNTVFSSAIFLGRRFRRSSDTEFNSSSNSSNVETIVISDNFIQKLDHFNLANDQDWSQRYWTSSTHFKKGGPAFLLVNGAGAVNSDTGGFDLQWLSYAKELNAICFSLEHRFYGKSWPAKEGMHYLSIGQALADIANFITEVTELFELPKDIKWIVFGCSYGGRLAALARLKYPHLIHGAVASSPALDAITDNYEYVQIVEESLKSYDPNCVESIIQATEEIARLNNSTENLKNISHMFHLCDDDGPKNIRNITKSLFSDMVDILYNAVQHNDVTQINIRVVCNVMMDYLGTKLEAFAELRKMYMKSKENYNDDDSASHAWEYQVCSELGGGLSSFNKTKLLFALSHLYPFETRVKDTCEQFFGPNIQEMNEIMNHTNLLYGGLDFNVANTLFIYGSLDPWYASGLYKKTNGSLYETIFINGTSHCSDTYLAGDNDSPELKNARRKTLEILKTWLKK